MIQPGYSVAMLGAMVGRTPWSAAGPLAGFRNP